ncbi:MAG: toprim domain-containing protein [Alphaproteobacteria bacterium]|nr:toprim domain-containing protein [Alphaproteobacteria bacterium]
MLTESAIDAYSFQVIHGGDGSRYMSTGGALNPQQPALLRGAMEKMPDGSIIILAFDMDDAGHKLAGEVEALTPAGRKVRRMLPEPGTGKDWNEALKYRLGLT